VGAMTDDDGTYSPDLRTRDGRKSPVKTESDSEESGRGSPTGKQLSDREVIQSLRDEVMDLSTRLETYSDFMSGVQMHVQFLTSSIERLVKESKDKDQKLEDLHWQNVQILKELEKLSKKEVRVDEGRNTMRFFEPSLSMTHQCVCTTSTTTTGTSSSTESKYTVPKQQVNLPPIRRSIVPGSELDVVSKELKGLTLGPEKEPVVPDVPDRDVPDIVGSAPPLRVFTAGSPLPQGEPARGADVIIDIRQQAIKDFSYAVEDRDAKVTVCGMPYGEAFFVYNFKIVQVAEVKLPEDLRPSILTYREIKLVTKFARVAMVRTTMLRTCGIPSTSSLYEQEFEVSYELFSQLINPTNASLAYNSIDAAKRIAEQSKDTREINFNRYLNAKQMHDTVVLAHHYLEYLKYDVRELDFPVAQGSASTQPSTAIDTMTLRSQRSAVSRKELGFFRSIIWIIFVMFLFVPHWASMSWVQVPLMVTLTIFPLLLRVSRSVYQVNHLPLNQRYLTNFQNLLRPGFWSTLHRLIIAQDYLLETGCSRVTIRLLGGRRLSNGIIRLWMIVSTSPLPRDDLEEFLNWLSALLRTSITCLINTYVVSLLVWMMLRYVLVLILSQLRMWYITFQTLLSTSQ
jgi:hypothetical protein